MAVSVLLVTDQRAGRAPDVCVLTGERTEHAVRLKAVTWQGERWLLWVPGFATMLRIVPKHPTFPVMLPVSERIWRLWRQRTASVVVLAVFGITLAIAGLIKSAPLLVVIGAIATGVALVRRVRSARDYWVTCTFQPAAGTVRVSPTHQAFDDAAKRLFVKSVG